MLHTWKSFHAWDSTQIILINYHVVKLWLELLHEPLLRPENKFRKDSTSHTEFVSFRMTRKLEAYTRCKFKMRLLPQKISPAYIWGTTHCCRQHHPCRVKVWGSIEQKNSMPLYQSYALQGHLRLQITNSSRVICAFRRKARSFGTKVVPTIHSLIFQASEER